MDRVAVGKEVIPTGASGDRTECDRCEPGTGATPMSILPGAPDGRGILVGSALLLYGARQSSEGCMLGQTGLSPPACPEIPLLPLLERRPQPGEDEHPATPMESRDHPRLICSPSADLGGLPLAPAIFRGLSHGLQVGIHATDWEISTLAIAQGAITLVAGI